MEKEEEAQEREQQEEAQEREQEPTRPLPPPPSSKKHLPRMARRSSSFPKRPDRRVPDKPQRPVPDKPPRPVKRQASAPALPPKPGRRGRSAGLTAQGLEYATLLMNEHGEPVIGQFGKAPAPMPREYATVLCLGMTYGRENEDQLRLETMLAQTNVDGVFAVDKAKGQGVGYAEGNFSKTIPFCKELKPTLIVLDWHFANEADFREGKYGYNWFCGKIHAAMEQSGARAFIMPNLKDPAAKDKNADPDASPRVFMRELFSGKPVPSEVRPWEGLDIPKPPGTIPPDMKSEFNLTEADTKRIPGFKEYNSWGYHPRLSYFMMTNLDVECLHPLVSAGIEAKEDLKRMGGQALYKAWAHNSKYVSFKEPFYVFHRETESEASIRFFLNNLTATACPREAQSSDDAMNEGDETPIEKDPESEEGKDDRLYDNWSEEEYDKYA